MDDLAAAQQRIELLEAQAHERQERLAERQTALEAREAELREVRDRLWRVGGEKKRSVKSLVGLGAAMALPVLALVVVTTLTGRSDRADYERRLAGLEAELDVVQRARRRLEQELAQRPRPAPPRDRERAAPWPVPPPPPSPIEKSGLGKLMGIAIGGTCAFSIDGVPRGSGSSVRVQVPVGPHTVGCLDARGVQRQQRVVVQEDRPGIASFKL